MGDIDAAWYHVREIVHDHERSGEVERLLGLDTSWYATPRDAASLRAMALLHWYRHLALPGFDGLRERDKAAELFRRLDRTAPNQVPEAVREVLGGERQGGEPGQDGGRSRWRRGGKRVPWGRTGRTAADVLTAEQAARLDRLRADYRDRGDIGALRALVAALAEYLPRAAEDHERAALLTDLASATGDLALATGDGSGLTVALNAADRAVTLTPADDPHLARRLVRRGMIKAVHGSEDEAADAVRRALPDYRWAATLALRARPLQPDVVEVLGRALSRGYELTGAGEFLLHEVGVWRDLRDASEAGVRLRAAALLDEAADELAAAIGPEQAGWVLTAHQDPGVIEAQFRLVRELADQADTDNSPALMGRRQSAALGLVAALPLTHDDRPAALLELCEADFDGWQLAGEAQGAVRAFDLAQEAAAALPPEHPLLPSFLSLLASAGEEVASHSSSPAIGDVAVAAARRGVDLAGPDPDDRARRLDALGRALRTASEVGDDAELLRDAVERHREAVALTRPGSPGRPLRHSHLATALTRLGLIDGDDTMLAEAVEQSSLAVRTLPPNDVRRVGLLYNYATAVSVLAGRGDAAEPFVEAELAYRAALALLPPGHPDHPRIRSAVAATLNSRYRACGDVQALTEAVALARQAVEETPRDHHWWPIRAQMFTESARNLARLGGPDAAALRAEVLAHCTGIAESAQAPDGMRMAAERERLDVVRESGDPAATLEALERVVAAVPRTLSRALPGRRRLAAVHRLEGLAADAVAAAVAAGDPQRGVELAERCRGLLFAEAWGIRRGWATLQRLAPDLAAALDRVEKELAKADSYSYVARFTIEVEYRSKKSVREWNPRPANATRTRDLAAERERLIAHVRALPGFADFLEPPTTARLRHATAGAPAVLVAAHALGGAALVVPGDPARPVTAVRLPGLRDDVVRDLTARLRKAVADAHDQSCPFDRREAAQGELHDVLEWLWDHVAEPVLDAAVPHGAGGPEPPRLWWCPVGTVSHLPLHAAGHHRAAAGRSPVTVYDRVVSSYTPTLTALADTLGTPGPASRSALVVGVAETPGHPVLDHAHAEARHVAGLLPGSTLLLDAEATLDAVQQGLREHPVAHFVCHGNTDPSSATQLRSGLVLGGTRLSPSIVHDLRLDHAALAFLSACDTAGAHPVYEDEPLHLASAFHLAGFRGVIGTLWHTRDRPEVAEAVYASLTAGGTAPADTASVAASLNDALRALRDAYPAVPTRWAGHIHVGV